MFKTIILSILVTMLICCVTNKKNIQVNPARNSLSVLDSYYYHWAGGAPGLKGMSYFVTISKPSEKLIFKNIWVHDLKIKLKQKEDESRIVLSAAISKYEPDIPPISTQDHTEKRPVSSDAEGIISYMFNGNIFYLEIETFKKHSSKTHQ